MATVKGELVQCPATACLGKGFYPCSHCNHQGFSTCHSCDGKGQTSFETVLYYGTPGTISYMNCGRCEGTGKEYCTYCSGLGQEQFVVCSGTGKFFRTDQHWVDSAAMQGNPYAQLYRGRTEKSLEWITKAANQNLPEAYYELAINYKYGLRDFEKNETKSKKYMDKAKELGYPEAMVTHPPFSFDEKDFPDFVDGAIWNYKAAELGNAEAIYFVKKYAIDWSQNGSSSYAL